ncbi:MAG TPA: hypothetical protein VFU02_03835 [Polyangiaceae bacterium]|nr:hypothetical protein [Polyangiaceae bacterium]
MQTAEGARFTLRLDQEEPAKVVYEFQAELDQVRLVGSVTVELGAGAVVVRSEPAIPEWLENTVVGLVRSLWRARNNVAAPAPWPRRLTRWRHPAGAQVR